MKKSNHFRDQHCETKFRLIFAAVGFFSLVLFNALRIEIQVNWVAGFSIILTAMSAANTINYRTKKTFKSKGTS